MKTAMTNEEILVEIERLRTSPYVKLAKTSENHTLRQKLYVLRHLEKQGRKLAEEAGIDFEESADREE